MTHHPRVAAAAALLLLFGGSLRLKADETPFALKDNPPEFLDVLRDGKRIARYMYRHDSSTPDSRQESYKPYLQVFAPDGETLITKGPGGLFPHHRGIFIGWNKMSVNGKPYDRWHMKGGDQIHEKFIMESATTKSAGFTSLVRWSGASETTSIVEEERTFIFLPPPAPAYVLIETTSKLKAVDGAVVLDGDPEHAGLHFRPADQVEKKATTYLYPKRDATPHKDLDYPWVAETFVLSGQPYSVVYLNHPSNPKGVRCSAYRDYGRFGMFWRANIDTNGIREFRARFLVLAGAMPSAEFIQKAWNEYAGANDPVPQTTAKPAETGK